MKAMKHLLLASALVVGLGTASAFADQPVDDTALAAQVKTALSSNPALAGTKIAVESKGGIIQLSGTVATDDQYAEAFRAAVAVNGVQAVKDLVITLNSAGA